MDLYTLDSGFHKDEIVDEFETLIWTERYNEFGDATIVIPTNSPFRNLLVEGTFLSIPGSREVMMIETVSDEKGVRTIVAKSLVAIFLERFFRNTWSTARNDWTTTDYAANIAWRMVVSACGATGATYTGGVLPSNYGTYEVLPNLIAGVLASGSNISVAVPYGNLYDCVKMVCDLEDLGFSLYPDNIVAADYDLKFTAYAGLDRTSSQSTNSVVIFEEALDSLTDVKELRSLSGYKTAAYVWAKGLPSIDTIGIAHVSGTVSTVGFGRRTLMLDASDINAADYTQVALLAVLTKRAKNALANNNYVRMTDGKVVPQNQFIYGTHYNLGDLIELRATMNQKARVTEYIRTQDAKGEIAYPTLSVVD